MAKNYMKSFENVFNIYDIYICIFIAVCLAPAYMV